MRTVRKHPHKRAFKFKVSEEVFAELTIIELFTKSLQNFLRFFCKKVPSWLVRAKTSRTLKTEYTFNRYIKKYEPSSPVAKAYAEFAKEVSADGRKKERLHSTDAR